MVWETEVKSQVESYQKLKMVLDTSFLNTQHYKVWIKSKWSNSGKGVTPSLHLDVVAIEKGDFGSPSIPVGQLTYIRYILTLNITEGMTK